MCRLYSQEVTPIHLEGEHFPILNHALRAQHRTFCFTKIMKAPIALLRSFGIRLVVYLDHILITASSPQRLSQDTTLTISLLTRLGFTINDAKSALTPCQRIEFLGMMIDSKAMTLCLPKSSLADIISRCRSLARKGTCTARQLAALIGSMGFVKR